MSDKKNIDVNINTSYTINTPVVSGEIIATKSIEVDEMSHDGIGVHLDKGITLHDLHEVYVQNENSGEAAYAYLTDFLNENKNNPEAIQNTVSSILAELNTKYDSNLNRGELNISQAEYLSTIFSSGKGDETSSLICGTIHNFLRDTLQDCGIEAVSVVGANIPNYDVAKENKKYTMHACLLYKNNDGTYTFNNYGTSATIKASNIKDALYTVHKETGSLESGGQITIYDKNGSYQEYALQESAAFGNIIDKRSYNNYSPTTNPVAPNSSLDVSTNITSTGNITANAGITYAMDIGNVSCSATVAGEYKKSGPNREFNKSNSLGVKAEAAVNWAINDNIGVNGSAQYVYNNTNGTLEGTNYTNNYDQTIKTPDSEINYQTAMFRRQIGVSTKLINNDNTQLANTVYASIQNYKTFGNSDNHYSKKYDERITIEDGISLNTNNLNANISGGIVKDLYRHNDGYEPTLGTKFNADVDYNYKPNENLALSISTSGYSVFTETSTDFGANTNLSAVWNNSNPNSKVNSVFGSVGTSFEQQDLHIGGTTQTTEKNLFFNITTGVDVGKNSKISLNYQQSHYGLNNTRNQKQIMATYTHRF